jgi:hypothetical protein
MELLTVTDSSELYNIEHLLLLLLLLLLAFRRSSG